MKAYILAGGDGKRLADLALDVPKPLIPIAGKPVIEWQLIQLEKAGFTDVNLIIKEDSKYRDLFGKSYGRITLTYEYEESKRGTGGWLNAHRDDLNLESLVLYGDIIFNLQLDRLVDYWETIRGLAVGCVVVHDSTHPKDSSILKVEDGIVTEWYNKGEAPPGEIKSNAGIYVFNRYVFDQISYKVDLDDDVIKHQVPARAVYAYDTDAYVKDMGTLLRFNEVDNYVTNNKWKFE
jgi:D-glycero-D-manno-heptose 1,7-bisphosphate phosphatase